jgi:hypothetical protein
MGADVASKRSFNIVLTSFLLLFTVSYTQSSNFNKHSLKMRFISVVLILGLVAGVFAAPVVNPDTET